MNYKSVKTSKSTMVRYNFSKNVFFDVILKNLFNLSKLFSTRFKSFFNSLFTPIEYLYDENLDTYKPYNNHYFKDTTSLKLKASQRTFL